jgi:hypothetical protein
MIYEFWDIRNHNLIDAFDSEREALLALRDAIRMEGHGVTDHLMLIEDDPVRNASRVMAVGTGLIYRMLTVR